MVMESKLSRRKDEVDYRKLLDRTGKFDQLIMELGRENALTIGVVPLGQNHYPNEASAYDKKIMRRRGKHSA